MKEALPKKAKPIITPVVAEAKTYVHGLALKVLESPKFGQLWTPATVTHMKPSSRSWRVSTTPRAKKFQQHGQIVINVSPTLQNVIDKANARGITIFNPLKAVLNKGENGMSVAIVSTEQVSKYSGAFNLLVKLGWWVPVIAIVLGILAIVVAVDRRRTLLRVAVGVRFVHPGVPGRAGPRPQRLPEQGGGALLQTGCRGIGVGHAAADLKTDFRWMLLASVLVALVAWVFGPARAVAIRSAFVRAGRWVAAQACQLSGKTGDAAAGSSGARRTGAWVLDHINALRIVGVVIAAGFLLLGGNLTGWSLLIIVIVLAVYIALIQLVAVRPVGSPAVSVPRPPPE